MEKSARTAINDSFKELLQRKSLDKITVKEICEHCGVNRQTFYYYYMDKMHVFKYIVLNELSRDVAQNRTLDTWEGGFMATMNYFLKNARMIMHVYHSSYFHEAQSYFDNLSEKLLYNVVEECVENMEVKLPHKDQMFIVHFYRHVFNGLILD